MTTELPLVNRYLSALDAALVPLAPAERADVVAEIRQHIADATAAGKPIDEVLQALGTAESLARAYRFELLVSPRPSAAAQPRTDRWLKIVGLLAIGSFPTFIVVVTLGTIGLTLFLTGIGVLISGLADSIGALPWWANSNVPPWVAVVVGSVLASCGVLASLGTVAYLRFVVRLVRRVVPPRATATP